MTSKVKLNIVKLPNYDEALALPSYETTGAAGADLRASIGPGESLVIHPGQRLLVPTGLAFEIPHGYEVQIRPRSGMSLKTDILVVNSPGTIDCDYRGEVKIILGNFGSSDYTINHGDRIAQMVIAPVLQADFQVVDSLSDTERGSGGFGSTGTN
ncbi:dUTP diphosphatase [Bacteriovorax sp. Seq25_V]|uniref:dUTP diphosphatase n=1 Tax=Bacteriovorax sp. Seq25_V TaxID=1201288 RepID=UPI000389E683|nr:dUTP diphosphatase [Bacteriovorax sp. Seq25_V]EQC46341.1 dUTP diphosphatase [Bacteriovorax sp. Seq25_V]